jgi:hypothetical protein
MIQMWDLNNYLSALAYLSGIRQIFVIRAELSPHAYLAMVTFTPSPT